MKLDALKIIEEYKNLLKPLKPSNHLLHRRIREIERDIIIPIKVILIGILIYYLFFTQPLTTVTPLREIVLQGIRRFFVFYIAFNIGIVFSLLGIWKEKMLKLRWLLVVNSFFDSLLVAILTLITGGFESVLYWLFVALMLRNALLHLIAAEQISLNLLICLVYIGAGSLEIKIREREAESYITMWRAEQSMTERTVGNRNSEKTDTNKSNLIAEIRNTDPGIDENTLRALDLLPPENPTEPVFLRTTLLVLFAACFYGLQLLLLRTKMAEHERHQFESRSEQLKSASRIAAEIAHQVKNQLAVIKSSVYVLEKLLKEPNASIQQQIELIRTGVDKVDNIIVEILGYGKLAEGRIEKLNVIETLESSLEQVFPKGSHHEIKIDKNFNVSEPFVMMQRYHLQAIFINLLQNAREALNDKGKIEINISRNAKDDIVISIKDNGPGIPEDKKQRIFEPYFTTKKSGTGLGLAIVKQNLDIYGGTIRVESAPGNGAEFIITLPAVRYEAGE
ncbi:MAG: ATP-binding protein [Verrucomicrobiae bacterium]|nr:ATP-binding protein [Verrucomicrobiae bacterium]